MTEQQIIARLSDRDRSILQLMAAGTQDKEIARQLRLSLNTVKAHNRIIRATLRANNRAQCAVIAAKAGLV